MCCSPLPDRRYCALLTREAKAAREQAKPRAAVDRGVVDRAGGDDRPGEQRFLALKAGALNKLAILYKSLVYEIVLENV